jgi:hypothetical protein
MPSEAATKALRSAWSVGGALWRITITNPWYFEDPEGNREQQRPALGGVLAGIKSAGGMSGLAGRGKTVALPLSSWIETGRSTLHRGKGVCTDCAAAAALALRSKEPKARIEIMSVATHAFVVCGREGGEETIKTPGEWGEDAFVLDIWLANQYKKGKVDPAAWMSDRTQKIVNWIFEDAPKLRVETEFPADGLTLRLGGG